MWMWKDNEIVSGFKMNVDFKQPPAIGSNKGTWCCDNE